MVDQSHILGLGEGCDQIRRIAAGGNADQGIAGLGLGDQLANEDVLETDIVADRGDHRQIGDQIDGRKRRSSGGDGMDEFDRNMGGVTARAAVAHGEHAAAAAIDSGERLGGGDENVGFGGEKPRIGLARVPRLFLDRMHQHRIERSRIVLLAVKERIERFQFAAHGRCSSSAGATSSAARIFSSSA